MAYDLKEKLVVAVSSRALFNLETENKIFEEKGLDAYYKYQLENEESALERARYVNDNDLGGIIIWEVTTDVQPTTDEALLLGIIGEELRNPSGPAQGPATPNNQ